MISIIVPVYNIEKYITECIESIINQTYVDFELLLIDDGSTDSSGAICDNYSNNDSRIQVIHKSNGGLVSAWKKGINLARGEWTVFVDGDDFINGSYIEELYVAIEKDVDMVCSNFSRYWEDGTVSKQVINTLTQGTYICDDKFYGRFINDEGSRDKLISNNRVTKIIKTEVLKKCCMDCSDEVSFGEDYQLTVRVLTFIKKFKVIDNYGYFYRYNPTSIVNTYKNNLWQRSKKLFETIDKIPDIQKINNYRLQTNTELLLYFVNCLKNEYYYGHFDKITFKKLIEDEKFIDAIKEYNIVKMWRLDKMLLKAAKQGKYNRVKAILYLYKFYCKLRGYHY